MPSNLRFRLPRPDEAHAVADLLNACSVAEIGVPDTTAEEVRSAWERPDRHVEEDALLAELDGRIVGYVEVDGRPPWTSLRIDGYVRPQAMGNGIGSALLERGEARARTLAALAPSGERVVLFHGVWHGSPGGRLLQARGYEPSRVFWRMRIDMTASPPAPEWPAGISVRRVRPDEERAMHAAMEEAFADHWEHRPVPFDRWLHDYVTHPGFDRSMWFAAVDRDEIVGGLICRLGDPEEPEGGWVDHVAVRRPWRGRGVALALLLHTFGELYRRGVRSAALGVDAESPTGAHRLYERAGMRIQRRIDVYAKELVAPEAVPIADITPGA